MKKFFNSVKIIFALGLLTLFASCGNIAKNISGKAYDKAYLAFSVNSGRSVYNPQAFTADDADALRFYIKEYGKDVNDVAHDILYEKTFLRDGNKNAVQVFEESLLELPQDWNYDTYYNFIIEICDDDLSRTQSQLDLSKYDDNQKNRIPYVNPPEANQPEEKYYMPLQAASKEKVLVRPGLNTLNFETKRYRKGDWIDYFCLLDFNYYAKVSETGCGYMEAELREWPYSEYEKWIPDFDIIYREQDWSNNYPRRFASGPVENGIVRIKGKLFIPDGYYKFIFKLYDKEEEPRSLVKSFSDVINLNAYKTVAGRELTATSLAADKLVYGQISIDEPWDLCVNHGEVTVTDTTPVDNDKEYEVALNYNGEELLATTLSKADMKLSWTTDIFTGKTAVNGVYACQLLVDDQEFDLLVPDRQYLSCSIDSGETNYLDPDTPPSLEPGDYFIHLEGAGQEQYPHEEERVDTESGNTWMEFVRDFKTMYDYTHTLLEKMNEDAKVFLDMRDVTGITKIFREDIQLTENGALLTGLALPESVENIEDGVFVCPIKQAAPDDDRDYELTIVFGSQALYDGAGNYTFTGLVDSGDNWMYWDESNPERRNLYNPFKKFIVSKDNPSITTYQDGALLAVMADWDRIIIASADVIENLKVPSTIRKIEKHAFAGNRKLKTVSDWGFVEEICFAAFNASALEGNIEFGNRVFEIASWAFGNTNITSLTLSDSMKLIFDHAVPDNTYIGYKPGSNNRSFWAWISKDTYDNLPDLDGDGHQDQNIYELYFNGGLPIPNNRFSLKAWQVDDFYKYKDYQNIPDFSEGYCWLIEE